MISQKRADELLKILLEDKQVNRVSNQNTANPNEFKDTAKDHANIIFKHSNVTDIKNEDIVDLVLDFIGTVRRKQKETTIPLDREYIISNCSELNTGEVLYYPRDTMLFEPVISNYLVGIVSSCKDTHNEVSGDKEFYDFMIQYIYDRLPNSMILEDAEESVKQMFEMTK